MYIKKTDVIRTAITVFLSVIFLFSGKFLSPPADGSGYAILRTDPGTNDDETVSMLHAGGIRGIAAVSTQTVFMDDFGDIKEIPLTQYGDYLAGFDPRNDGYAEKLESFFYQDGKRLAFIPLAENPGTPGALTKQVNQILVNIPHELRFLNAPAPRVFPWILFALSLGCVFYFFRSLRPLIHLFFPMAGFVFWGSPGLVSISLLGAVISVLVYPVKEYFTAAWYGKKRSFKDQLRTYLFSWISGGILLLIYLAVLILTNISLVFGLVVFGGVSGLFVFSIRWDVLKGASLEHVRFLPVPIAGYGGKNPGRLMPAVPFICASLVLLVSSVFFTYTFSDFSLDPSRAVTREDYESHIRFQSGFSFNPLGRTSGSDQYKTYTMGADGLISQGETGPAENLFSRNPGDFPLDGLTGQILGAAGRTIPWNTPENIISLVCFLLMIPVLFSSRAFRRGRKKIITMYNDKRIAA